MSWPRRSGIWRQPACSLPGPLSGARRPTEVSTDRAPVYPRVLDELVPEAWHVVGQYANNPIEADHGRLKARTRPMRGLQRIRSAQAVCSGHAFVQNLRRGHYELGLDTEADRRLEVVFTEKSAYSSPTQQRRSVSTTSRYGADIATRPC
jgi:DDE domain